MWSLPCGYGTVAGLFNSIALSEGLYLADAINATLAQAAYGATLYRDSPAWQRPRSEASRDACGTVAGRGESADASSR